MIVNLTDSTTRDIFDGVDSKHARKVPKQLWSVAARKLDMLDAATRLDDLKAPPANRLEKLKGALAGYYSMVNEQYRIVFKFAAGNAQDVHITDYH